MHVALGCDGECLGACVSARLDNAVGNEGTYGVHADVRERSELTLEGPICVCVGIVESFLRMLVTVSALRRARRLRSSWD